MKNLSAADLHLLEIGGLHILKPIKVITVNYLVKHHEVPSNKENENEDILNSNDFYLA